jgi:hypothetical protein
LILNIKIEQFYLLHVFSVRGGAKFGSFPLIAARIGDDLAPARKYLFAIAAAIDLASLGRAQRLLWQVGRLVARPVRKSAISSSLVGGGAKATVPGTQTNRPHFLRSTACLLR